MRALIVEDHSATAEGVRRVLVGEGMDVEVQADGTSGLAAARAGTFDLVVLDLRLPDGDGVELCHRLRADGDRVAILMLSGRGSTTEVVRGLEAGADDYLAKPVAVEELRARIRAVLRRAGGGAMPASPPLQVGDLEVELEQRHVRYVGREVELTAREFDLLAALVRADGRVRSRSHLLREVWGQDPETANAKVVDVYVRYLRHKLTPGGGSGPIETIRGVGYRLAGGPAVAST